MIFLPPPIIINKIRKGYISDNQDNEPPKKKISNKQIAFLAFWSLTFNFCLYLMATNQVGEIIIFKLIIMIFSLLGALSNIILLSFILTHSLHWVWEKLK